MPYDITPAPSLCVQAASQDFSVPTLVPRGSYLFDILHMFFLYSRVIDVHFSADSMWICLLVFAQLSLKVEPFESESASTKTEFDMK